MKANRRIEKTPGTLFFQPGFPFYVNRIEESFELMEHSHDFYEISYVAEGRGYHHIGEETIAVRRGDLFWIPLGTSHVFRPSDARGREPLIVYNCIFTEEAFGRVMDEDGQVQGLQQVTEWRHVREQGAEFAQLLEPMLREFLGRKPGYRLWVQSDWSRLMILLHRRLVDEGSAVRPARALAELLDQIALYPERSYTLAWAADLLGWSVRHTQRQVKAHTGVPFKTYVHNSKIQACCERLRETDSTIPEIARWAGFQDLKHFHALFKRKTGMTPGQYRKEHQV
ncbi:helix-turn-helix domain-containing protein [Paenibacillus daejeonensis]|uniref:helix-turn-helix domain-containing protein n=1 Tax=Paenibacillus daejeonensis TaxID=135193 RepID=UPI00035F9910|nr:AraC family transcriptional regulator [Paenibacillus daejeonensis]